MLTGLFIIYVLYAMAIIIGGMMDMRGFELSPAELSKEIAVIVTLAALWPLVLGVCFAGIGIWRLFDWGRIDP